METMPKSIYKGVYKQKLGTDDNLDVTATTKQNTHKHIPQEKKVLEYIH